MAEKKQEETFFKYQPKVELKYQPKAPEVVKTGKANEKYELVPELQEEQPRKTSRKSKSEE